MKISVITVNRNHLEGLQKTFQSIVAQTYKDWEWIVIDGGSTDGDKDFIEALRIIYNSEDTVITHKMLVELRDRLLAENRQYGSYQLWKSYKILDEEGNVDDLDIKHNVNALTNLIQLVRYAYKKNQKLIRDSACIAARISVF